MRSITTVRGGGGRRGRGGGDMRQGTVCLVSGVSSFFRLIVTAGSL